LLKHVKHAFNFVIQFKLWCYMVNFKGHTSRWNLHVFLESSDRF